MKYRINGEIIAAQDLAKQPDAKLYISAIQTAQALAFTEAGIKAMEASEISSSLSRIRLEGCFERQLALIGIEIIK